VGTHSSGAALLLAALLADPLASFRPTVALDDDEHRALDQGRAVVRGVSVPSRHLGVFVAIRVGTDGDRMARWIDNIAAFKRSDAIKEIGRFSNPPHIDDLAGLTLDPEDTKTLRGCTPGHCSMLFTADEIARLADPLGRSRPWQDADLLGGLREILLRRAENYLAAGRTGEPAPAFIQTQWPELARALEAQPPPPVPGASKFLYWEKVRLGGKPIITITHVTVFRESAAAAFDLLSIGRHVFSTRYISDGWSVLGLLPPHAERPYLTYLYQARVDRFGGLFGHLMRQVAQREIKARAAVTLIGLRDRLEGGEAPATNTEGWP
jgi:hypothetical protein